MTRGKTMSETTRRSSRQPPWEGDVAHESGAFGGWLRREREAREVTLGEISDVTKISRSYLEALEEERFDVLPAPVFAKGFLREYAKYVGLDPDEVVNSYLTALQAGEPDTLRADPEPAPRSTFEWKAGLLLAIGLVALLAAIGFLGFWSERSQPEAEAGLPAAGAEAQTGAPVPREAPILPPVEEPTQPAPVTPPPASGPPAALVVTIDFTSDCWVEASVDGRRRLSELHVQGESLQIDAEERVELTLGNPGAVRVEVNGEPYPLPEYRPGRVARDIVIALEDGE
jgi:cytoskeletal protein RodZ